MLIMSYDEESIKTVSKQTNPLKELRKVNTEEKSQKYGVIL